MPETILITGSNGLLGQKLVCALLDDGTYRVVATATGPCRMKDSKNFTYQELDITQRDAVFGAIAAHRPSVVFNTAAMTNVDACETGREACTAVNVTAVQHLAEACEQVNAHLVHLSTDFVFDGRNGPYREDDEPAPLSFYAQSKLDSEKIVRALSVPWTIIRTIIIYGVCDNRSRSNIVLWVKESLAQGKVIRIVNDQFRMPTLAEDLAQACLFAAKKKATGIYHVSGKDLMSIYELALEVARHFGLDETLITPIATSSLSQPAPRPPRTGFVLDKANRELGYRPHSLKEGLKIVEKQLKDRAGKVAAQMDNPGLPSPEGEGMG